MVRELEVYVPLAPIHMPVQLALIDIALHTLTGVPQVACFDTAFHRTMPAVARATGLPRHLTALGVERYGFHGLAYASTLEQLRALYGVRVANGCVVICYLGNGASVAALKEGASVDTSMGLTPGSGLVMSTRSGDVDPGLFAYLATRAHMSLEDMTNMCMHEAGLLGMSGLSADMKTLIEHEGANPYAKEAVQTFCYRVTKEIGAYAAVLDGIDTLVFTGGIGEQAPRIRKRICTTLGYLCIELDTKANSRNAAVLAKKGGRTAVYIVHPHEDAVLASHAASLLYERR
jgi:acetate kinase